ILCHGHPARARPWPGWPWHVGLRLRRPVSLMCLIAIVRLGSPPIGFAAGRHFVPPIVLAAIFLEKLSRAACGRSGLQTVTGKRQMANPSRARRHKLGIDRQGMGIARRSNEAVVNVRIKLIVLTLSQARCGSIGAVRGPGNAVTE